MVSAAGKRAQRIHSSMLTLELTHTHPTSAYSPLTQQVSWYQPACKGGWGMQSFCVPREEENEIGFDEHMAFSLS